MSVWLWLVGLHVGQLECLHRAERDRRLDIREAAWRDWSPVLFDPNPLVWAELEDVGRDLRALA